MEGNLRFLREGQGSTPRQPPASQACSLISTLMLHIQTQICFGHQPPSTCGLISSNLQLSDLGGGGIQLSARRAHASGPQATFEVSAELTAAASERWLHISPAQRAIKGADWSPVTRLRPSCLRAHRLGRACSGGYSVNSGKNSTAAVQRNWW